MNPYFLFSTIYQYKKDWENSIKYLERAISFCPEMFDTLLLLSTAYQHTGDHKRALQLAEECLNKEPTDEWIQQHWKWLCEEQGIEPNSKLPEEKKMDIYKDLREEIDSVFLLGRSLMSDFASASLDPFGGLARISHQRRGASAAPRFGLKNHIISGSRSRCTYIQVRNTG